MPAYHFDLIVEVDPETLWGSVAAEKVPQGIDEESELVYDVIRESLSIMDGMGVKHLFLRGIDQQ